MRATLRSGGVDEAWADLIRRVQAGDERAFSTLWRAHQPSLLRYLEVVASRGAAEDLAAETWISIVRSLPRFRGTEAGFKSLLFTTARSRMVDGARRAKARPQVTDLDGPLPVPATGSEGVPEAVEQAEATRAALALITRLPPGQAEVVALRTIGGLDTAEVAKVTGKRSGTVRVAYSRGLAALAAILAEQGEVTDPGHAAFR